MVKAPKMNQQRKLSSRLNNGRQSSAAAETASVGSTRSIKSNGSSTDFQHSSSFNQPQGILKRAALSKHGSQESADSGTGSQPTSILNVAEMLLHGVADSEILDIWLRSIQCEEFVTSFVEAGYDMPTISRITPADLAAIGVTDPTKRLKILTEIKKLNLQDGIPNFRPTSLSQWLSLIRLESYYYKSLCDQQINSIEKLCQLTWEDFEELGISKLGHQKRFQLAIERLKELDGANAKGSAKGISEPIYDTNPSQILLVASTENHSMNGPIINKQSSTSELSSTGSGSMHSVYSSASTQYQSSYAPPPDTQQSGGSINGGHNHLQQQVQQQPIYSQMTPSIIYQQPSQLLQQQSQHQQQLQQQSHYQSVQQLQSQFTGSSINHNNLDNCQQLRGGDTMSHQSRQSLMCQLPFSALANLPKHQQQQLQQSSIYATLSRQPPNKMKQPPPPVPIRTNSLKTAGSTMTDNMASCQQQQQHQQALNQDNHNQYQQQQMSDMMSNGTLLRSGQRMASTTNTPSRTPFSSQTMLTKNKSFSGNAHMEASRARFLNRNSHHQQPLRQLSQQQMQTMNTIDQHQSSNGTNCNNGNQNNNIIYASQPPNLNGAFLNGRTLSEEETFRQLQQQQLTNNSYNQTGVLPAANGLPSPLRSSTNTMFQQHSDDHLDLHSDTNSIKSLLVAPSGCSMLTSSIADNQLTSSTQDSGGSSQTLYNSASSGSAGGGHCADRQSLTNNTFGNQFGAQLDTDMMQCAQSVSTCTLADAPNNLLTLDNQQHQRAPLPPPVSTNVKSQTTVGRDDDFPPPPSPLSMSGDSDEQEIGSTLSSSDSNFTELTHSMMTFRVT